MEWNSDPHRATMSVKRRIVTLPNPPILNPIIPQKDQIATAYASVCDICIIQIVCISMLL